MAGKKDIQFTVGSDTQKAVEDMQKLVAKHEELLAKQKAVTAEGKKSKGEMQGMGSIAGDIGKNALSIATGFISAEGAIKLANVAVNSMKRDYEDLIRRQKEAGDAVLKLAQNTIKAAGITGAGMTDQLQKDFVSTGAAFGMTTQEVSGAYQGYRVAGLADQQTSMEATRRIAKLNDIVDVNQTAEMAGQLKYAVPKLSAKESVNLAAFFTEQARGDAEKTKGALLGIQQLTEGDVDPEKAMAVAASFIQKGYSGKQMQTYSGMVLSPMEKVSSGVGRSLTEKQKLQNEYAGLSNEQRMEWLSANPDKAAALFGAQAVKMAPAISPEDVASARSGLTKWKEDAYMDEVLKKSAGQQAFLLNEVADRGLAAAEQSKLSPSAKGPAGVTRDQVNAWLDQNPMEWGPGLDWANRAFVKTKLNMTDYMGGQSYMEGAQEYLTGRYKGGPEPDQKALLELINSINALNENIKETNQKMQNGPTVVYPE